jgi:site-specific recombinase XerD
VLRLAVLRPADLDADAVTEFLDHLERDRGKLPRTRSARLAAVRSFFRYAALREPAHSDQITRVLSIPQNRQDKAQVAYLTTVQEHALVDAPDAGTWEGHRDRAFITLALHTGLRVSELLSLRRIDITLGAVAQVHCTGKGRKERALSLTPARAKVMRVWLRQIPATLDAAVFATRAGRALIRDAIEHCLAGHATTAASTCPSITCVHSIAHVLRHTCAMNLLHAGVDCAVIVMWLGHEDLRSTQAFLHDDMTIKERALERTLPI